MNSTGYVSGTRQPIITTTEESGTMIIFVKINHTGNLLKRVIVSGSVPAWAIIVTAADCQILSAP